MNIAQKLYHQWCILVWVIMSLALFLFILINIPELLDAQKSAREKQTTTAPSEITKPEM
jgi:hypothetical protein